MADYYNLLGISTNATESEIRAAYRKKAKLYHPDVNKSPDAHALFVLLTTAYETLINPHKRERYNTKGSRSAKSSFETYQEWMQKKKAQAEYEAQKRYQEFLRNREKFRNSRYYTLAIWVTYLAWFVSMLFGVIDIAVCFYLVYEVHFMLFFFVLPFICGGVYLIKWSTDWFKETKRYF